MRIGMYLGYGPKLGMSMINEGLGRYLSMLIKLLQNRGNEIVVACPVWLMDALHELIAEYEIDEDHIEYVTTGKAPVIWRLYERFKTPSTRKRVKLRTKIRRAANTLAGRLFYLLLRVRSMLAFALLGIAALVLGIVCLPFFLVIKVVNLLLKLVSRIFHVDARGKLAKLLNLPRTIKDKIIHFSDSPRGKALWARAVVELRENVVQELVTHINLMKNKADVWFCPTAFWKEFPKIKGVTVCCFPDLTTSVFADSFSDYLLGGDTDIIRDVVAENKYFITYCDYQKYAMMVNTLGQDERYIRSVSLFVNETLPYIDIRDAYPPVYRATANERFARRVLATLIRHAAGNVQPYLQTAQQTYAFQDMKYVFYSSQVRPNKNVMTLVRAYEYLLRKKEVDFKLVLTGNLYTMPDVADYVVENRLQYDILTFSMVSNQQLAALYACAELVVNPTLYEGGFLMIFSEGMSVGTPSVMSRIPQVTDVTVDFDMEDYLFNPVDYRDMADKILYGVTHRAELVEKQRPLYTHLSKWSGEDAGREYEEAFAYFKALDAQQAGQGRKGKEAKAG